jgi:ribosome-associated heat shock protein Hsp15
MSEASIRLDKWLWFARFRKSRSLAAELCVAGRVRVNRQIVQKPAAPIRVGDVVTVPVGSEIRVVRVERLGERRGPPAEARLLYVELPAVEQGGVK